MGSIVSTYFWSVPSLLKRFCRLHHDFCVQRVRSYVVSIRILTVDYSISGVWGSAYAWTPLIFDTTVVILTINKTVHSIRAGHAGGIVRTFFRDGIMYYR